MYSMISEMIFIHEMRNTNLWACQTNAEIGGNIIIFHWVSIQMFIPIHDMD